jgi:hypothetical protein
VRRLPRRVDMRDTKTSPWARPCPSRPPRNGKDFPLFLSAAGGGRLPRQSAMRALTERPSASRNTA